MQPDFTPGECAVIGIIGGADGPTAIYIVNNLAQDLVGSDRRSRIFLHGSDPADPAADHEAPYNKERASIVMKQLRKKSAKSRRLYSRYSLFCSALLLFLPSVAPLGMLMLGNLFL